LHTAGANAAADTLQHTEISAFGAPPSNASSTNASPVPFGMAPQPVPPMPQNQNLAIYEQTPFSRTDGSYSSSPVMPPLHMHQQAAAAAGPGCSQHSCTSLLVFHCFLQKAVVICF
uniref:PAM2 domain-containing protein n=1 Tax=Gongylonema pulchrum TaxID=637853 RepID=A0A183DFU4_9BILA